MTLLLVVTGATGLLGATLALRAHERGSEVVALSYRHQLAIPDIRAIQCDLRPDGAVASALRELRPEWIVHCAALTNVDWCEDHPDEADRVNARLPRELARFARASGAGLAYVSTDSVFDGRRGSYAEQDRPLPVNAYARSKLAGEAAVLEELERWLIIRTSIYGWNMQPKESLAEWFLHRLERGERVAGFVDVAFTPILVNDLSDAILDLIGAGLTGTYNVAGSEAVTKYEFGVRLAQVFGLDARTIVPRSIHDAGLRAPRPADTSLSTAKVSRALGRQMPDVGAGLRRFKELRDSGFVEKLKRLGPVQDGDA